MANLLIAQEDRVAKEQLLLGDVTLKVGDCGGNIVTVHGLTANDLVVTTLQGGAMPLTDYIISYAGATPDLTNSTVVNSEGETVTLQEVVDSVNEVKFELVDLQEKYNNL